MNKNFLPELNPTEEEYPSSNNLQEEFLNAPKQKKTLGNTVTAILAIAMVTLPVLSVGIANYYFDSHGLNKQDIRAKGTDTDIITQTKLAQRNHMLTIVLISTGTVALLVGTITGFLTIRTAKWNYEQALQRQEEQKKLFQEFIKYLSRSLDLEEILETTVEEAQKILGCDRVLVYSLSQNDYGKIIAEAVLPGWTRTLDKTIEDPSWETKYLEKSGNDYFYAFNDINEVRRSYLLPWQSLSDQAKLTPKYLKQLEKLGVKANLAVPIYHEDRLFAILSAHHCHQPHDWEYEEKQFLIELAARVSLALDNIHILAEASRLIKQTKTEDTWADLLNDTVAHLRQSREEEEILNVAVEEVRQGLNCDRVVVYSLNQNNYGMVMAESVAGGYLKALGAVIEDPCFASRYIELYSQGRVKAIDNIYQAGLSQCHLEQLEKLEVKANLVTPIIHNNKLFGLLIAHQCSTAYSWQQNEIRWVTQVASQVGFALDNAKLLAEQDNLLKRVETETQWNLLFSDTVGYIRQSLQQTDILHSTVEQVRKVLKCDRALVYSLNQDSYEMVIAESVAPGWTKVLGTTITDPCFATNYIKKYSDGRVKVTNNIYEANMTECHLQQLEQSEVKANLVTPIIHQNNLFGLLIVHQCSAPYSWQQHEIRWLTQIAKQVGFALDNAQLVKQSQTHSQIQPQTDVVEPTNYEDLSIQIAPVKITPISIDENMATVQEKLAVTKEKIKQINQASQKLLQIKNSINDKLNDNK